MNKKINQGKKYYNSGQYAKALAVLDKLEPELSGPGFPEGKNSPDGPGNADANQDIYLEFSYFKGLVLTKLERYDEALPYLEQVVRARQPGLLYLYQSRMILGYIYIITRRYKLAEQEFNTLLNDGIESVQIYALLGYVAYAQNKITQSIGLFKKALRIDPAYPNALNCLGFIYADKNIDTAEAVNLCKKAAGLKPANAAYLDSLGWAYYKNNQLPQARTVLSKALELAPENQEILAHVDRLMDKLA